MALLFGALFAPVYLHPLAFAFTGTETPGKNWAHYLLVLAVLALQSQWAVCRDTQGLNDKHSALGGWTDHCDSKMKQKQQNLLLGAASTHRKV